jgi:hypothetical protein
MQVMYYSFAKIKVAVVIAPNAVAVISNERLRFKAEPLFI